MSDDFFIDDFQLLLKYEAPVSEEDEDATSADSATAAMVRKKRTRYAAPTNCM